MTAPLHWHVHDDGTVDIYRAGQLLARLDLSAEQMLWLARDVALAASRKISPRKE